MGCVQGKRKNVGADWLQDQPDISGAVKAWRTLTKASDVELSGGARTCTCGCSFDT